MPSRILLTGATGFLGANLLRRLVADDQSVTVLVRRTSNLAAIEPWLDSVPVCVIGEAPIARILKEQEIGTVVHCATNYGRAAVPPTEIIESNLIFPLSILQQLATREGGATFINTDTILDKRVNYYSLSKSQFSEWLRLFSDRLSCANVALEHFYGPGDNSSKFAMDIVQKLLRGVPAIELTPGEQRRDFIYVDDVIEGLSRVINWVTRAPAGFYDYQVGSGVSTSIREFVSLVKELSGNTDTELKFGALPYRPNEVMATKVDTSRLCELGWQPRVSLEDGLRATIDSEKARFGI